MKLKSLEQFPIELLEKRIKEMEKFIEEKDAPQACEKIYSVVESCIKILAEKEKIEAWKEANEGKNWTFSLLEDAAYQLKDKKNMEKIYLIWLIARQLHREGFHENRMKIEQVKRNIWIAYEILKITKEALELNEKFSNS